MEIIKQFNLYADDLKNKTGTRVLVKMLKNIKVDTISADVIDPRNGQPAKATIAFTLTFEYQFPEIAQQVANQLVSLSLKENFKSRTESADNSALFMTQESKRLKDQIKEIQSELAAFKEKNLNQLPEAKQFNQQELTRAKINARIEELSENPRQSPLVEKDYMDMVRELDNTNLRYRELSVREMEAQISKKMELQEKGESFMLIDPPREPLEPDSPNRPLILLFGVVLAAGAGFGTGSLAESLVSTIHSERAIAAIFGFPPLATIPCLESEQESDECKQRHPKLILITFLGVILILTAFHLLFRPLDMFGYKLPRLIINAFFSGILVNPGIDRLIIIPASRPMINSTEMLHSPKILKLVNELNSRYPSRIIIFDMPPILSQDDTLRFSPYVDCLLLVIDDGQIKIHRN